MPRAPLSWRVATVAGVPDETLATRTLTLDVSDWAGHRTGQHVDVRLTAEDGYQAERSYSIGSEATAAATATPTRTLRAGDERPTTCLISIVNLNRERATPCLSPIPS